MATGISETIKNFQSFTGCTDENEARYLLDACANDIERAVDLYFQRQNTSSPILEEACSSRSTRRRRGLVTQTSSARARVKDKNGFVDPKSFNQIDDEYMVENDELRAPIPPVRGIIVEQSFNEQYQNQNRRNANSVFDAYRDFRAEAEEQLLALRNGTSTSALSDKRATLQTLFRPPIELNFCGDWESARAEAQKLGSWLLVNIQDVQEFACQALNRDIWSNVSVKELVKSNFLFWQIYHDSADGNRMSNYYQVRSYPAIFVVDPRMGELVMNFRAPDAVSFCDQVTTFLDNFPDYIARDRHLTGAATTTHSDDPTSSQSDDQPTQPSLCPIKSRKRVGSNSGSIISEDVSSFAKKSRFVEDMPDVEDIVKEGNKLTTIDYDEWKNWLGKADGKEKQISLILRLPDGNRSKMNVNDTTTLKAVFLHIAGLGFAACDHLLVLSYPKREISSESNNRTLRELEFGKQELIHVEKK